MTTDRVQLIAKNRQQPWTEEATTQLVALFHKRTPLDVLCTKLGRTPSGVIGKLTSLGWIEVHRDGHYYPVPPDPVFMWQEIKELQSQYKVTE